MFGSFQLPYAALGDFVFSINTASFNEVSRSSSYRWANSEVIGSRPVLQWLGDGEETITLPGVIVPEICGAMAKLSLSKLRDMASSGEPYYFVIFNIIDMACDVAGLWVIEGVEETGRELFGGMAQKIEFNIRLRRYQDPDDIIGNALEAINAYL